MSRVLIIGTGIAGLFAALRLANEGFDVEIITKQRPKDSSTNWAQGGIAAILDKTNLEEIDGHIKDTLDAGDGLCDETVVRMVVEEAGERIHDLLSIGVEFERGKTGIFNSQKKVDIHRDASFMPRMRPGKRSNAPLLLLQQRTIESSSALIHWRLISSKGSTRCLRRVYAEFGH